ncbi:MAG TPA: acyl-CoA dehydrogenase family protein [Actinomycetota bacterium]|nr:acyl-CoA dehydrogenase family protein [Actinomycetota bacterium]
MRWRIEDTPEQAEFRQQFLSWVKANVPDGWIEALEKGDETAFEAAWSHFDVMDWNRTIGAAGYAAPLWPKEYGGLSGKVWMQNVVREELARLRLPLFGINILGIGLAGPTLIEHASDAQKERYLSKILTSEEVWCQLFSEPGAGSDLASLATRAEKDGDEWVIKGQKVWTSIAEWAQFGMLVARTDPSLPKHEGLTYFICPMKAEGVEVRPLRQITGASEFNEVYFDGLRIPDANRVGEVGQGWEIARTTLMNERVALSGLSTSPEAFMGGARKDPWKMFVHSIPHRDDRLVRQSVARFHVEREVKEMTAFRAAAARRVGASPGAEGGVGKVFNAELNQRQTSFAMNAAGPGAIAWLPDDKGAEARARAFLRARGYSIEGGTTEILKNQLAERILGLPRDPAADKGVPWKDIKRS